MQRKKEDILSGYGDNLFEFHGDQLVSFNKGLLIKWMPFNDESLNNPDQIRVYQDQIKKEHQDLLDFVPKFIHGFGSKEDK